MRQINTSVLKGSQKLAKVPETTPAVTVWSTTRPNTIVNTYADGLDQTQAGSNVHVVSANVYEPRLVNSISFLVPSYTMH